MHGLDLLRFIFGDVAVAHVERAASPSGALRGFAAVLTSARGDIMQLSANWQAPANFRLAIDRPGRRVELRPFEQANLYEGMEVLEPTAERPIRSYRPKAAGAISLDDADRQFKPGFLRQAEALAALARGDQPAHAARLPDAHAAITLAEALAGQTYTPP